MDADAGPSAGIDARAELAARLAVMADRMAEAGHVPGGDPEAVRARLAEHLGGRGRG